MRRRASRFLEGTLNRRKRQTCLAPGTQRRLDLKPLGLEADGTILLDHADEGFSKDFYLYGFREPLNTLATYRAIQRRRPAVLDVGSNLGYFPLIELTAGAKQVVALEPLPATFPLLTKTLSRYEHVTLLNVAVSNRKEDLVLYVANERNGTSPYPEVIWRSGRRIVDRLTVPALPIATILETHPVDAVRMDVEGHEYEILAGRIPEPIRMIFLELHLKVPNRAHRGVAFAEHLDRQGFRTTIAIREIDRSFYPLVKHLGLSGAYRLLTRLGYAVQLKRDIGLPELLEDIRWTERLTGYMHLVCER